MFTKLLEVLEGFKQFQNLQSFNFIISQLVLFKKLNKNHFTTSCFRTTPPTL